MNLNGTDTHPPPKDNPSFYKVLERKTYLTFKLRDEVFAVDVQHVPEVLDFRDATRIPKYMVSNLYS